MSLPVSVPYAFANATTTQNLSSLDSNFNALANGLNGLANGSSQISVSSISATGTANSNTYLRGDGAWANISGGGSDVTYANVTVTQNLVPPSSYLRNRIINGAMQIDQRNAGASVTPTDGQYLLDRWVASLTAASKYTAQQSATAPTGFSNSLVITSSSAYSVAAGDIFAVQQKIEGFNFYDMAWGTANAKTVTLSFQVYSSLTGTFGGSFLNSATNRSYPFTYTISSANTWTQISVTVPGDTSGTWVGATNGIGVRVYFGLGVGSTYSGAAGSWSGSAYYSATGAVSVVGTNGATFYITGVQLEVGSNATPFERRLYGHELALCQRYYEQTPSGTYPVIGRPDTVNVCAQSIYYAVEKRASPTMTFPSLSGAWTLNVNSTRAASMTSSSAVVYVQTGFTSSAEL